MPTVVFGTLIKSYDGEKLAILCKKMQQNSYTNKNSKCKANTMFNILLLMMMTIDLSSKS